MPTFIYQGTWDASTSAPASDEGFLYLVSNPGTTSLDGFNSWNVGDQAFYLSSKWYQRKGLVAPAQFKGAWNASTNVPALPGSVAEGDLYLVTVMGNTNLGGIASWQVGDQALYVGGAWQRLVCTTVPDLSALVNPALIDPIYVPSPTTVAAGFTSSFRTVQEKLSDNVSVLDYGADPTGQVDSTPAFRNALATGLSVYVPAGNYMLVPPNNTDPILSMRRSGQVLYGDAPLGQGEQGGGACLIFKSTGASDAPDCVAIGDGVAGSTTYVCPAIRNLNLDCSARTGGNAIGCYRTQNPVIDGVLITAPYNGIYLWAINTARLYRITAKDVRGAYGYQLTGADNAQSQVVVMVDCDCSGKIVQTLTDGDVPGSGQSIVLTVDSTAGIAVGMFVIGSVNLPPGTRVHAIGSATSLTLMAPTGKVIGTITNNKLLTFGYSNGTTDECPGVAGIWFNRNCTSLQLTCFSCTGVYTGLYLNDPLDPTNDEGHNPGDLWAFAFKATNLLGNGVHSVNGGNMTFLAPTLVGSGGNGVIFSEHSTSMNIIGGVIAQHRYTGVIVAGQNFGLSGGCIVGENGQQAVRSYDGVEIIAPGALRVIIEGCQIGATADSFGQQRYGINLVQGTAPIVSGDTTAGSTVIQHIPGPDADNPYPVNYLYPGQSIAGAGFPPESVIVSTSVERNPTTEEITNRKISVSQKATATATGVSFAISSSPNEVLIDGNDLRGNGVAPVNDLTTATFGVNAGLARGATFGLLRQPTQYLLANLPSLPTRARIFIIDDLIARLMDQGIWAKLDILYLFAAADETIALKNWILPGAGTANPVATKVNAPAWTPNYGYTGNKTNQCYIDLGVALGGLKNATQNDMTMMVYSQTDVADNDGRDITTSINSNAYVLGRSVAGNLITRANATSSSSVSLGGGASIGLYGWNRTSSSSYSVYRNGAQLGSAVAINTTAPAGNFCVLGATVGGTAYYSPRQIAAVAIGAQLTSGQHLELYNAIQAYVMAVRS